jgi:hypothetical protein
MTLCYVFLLIFKREKEKRSKSDKNDRKGVKCNCQKGCKISYEWDSFENTGE